MIRRLLAFLNGDHNERLTSQRFIDKEQPKVLTRVEIEEGMSL